MCFILLTNLYFIVKNVNCVFICSFYLLLTRFNVQCQGPDEIKYLFNLFNFTMRNLPIENKVWVRDE